MSDDENSGGPADVECPLPSDNPRNWLHRELNLIHQGVRHSRHAADEAKAAAIEARDEARVAKAEAKAAKDEAKKYRDGLARDLYTHIGQSGHGRSGEKMISFWHANVPMLLWHVRGRIALLGLVLLLIAFPNIQKYAPQITKFLGF